MIYILIVLLLFYLSFIYDVRDKTKGKKFWYIFIQVILILLAGLRYRVGIDTINYINRFYEEYPSLDTFSFQDYPLGSDPLYALLNSIVISIGGKFYIVQLIHAAFVIVLISKYISKHFKYHFTFFLFYFIISFFEYNMEIMRASMSIVICLYGNDYILKKRWYKGFFLYFVAMLFHIQAALCLLSPLILKLKFNKTIIISLIFTFFFGVLIQYYFGDLINLISIVGNIQGKLDMYANSDFYFNSGRNLNYLIIYCFPLFFYTIASVLFIRKVAPNDNLIIFEPFVILGLFFMVLYMNIYITYRLIQFVHIYILLYISQMFVALAKQRKGLSISLKYIRVLTFFIPFFFLTAYGFIVGSSWRYVPYFSVVDRHIDKNRENELFMQMHTAGWPDVSYDKY